MVRPAQNVVANSTFGPIIINVNDQFITPQIFATGYWAVNDINLIKKILDFQLRSKKALNVYDVGANCGTHSLALAKLLGEKIRIRAFEVQPAIFHMLCGTIALNNLGNVRCHLNAVSDSDGESLEIRPPDYAQPNNFGGFEAMPTEFSDNQEMARSGATDTVTTVTLDSFSEPVDFIKMDVEGMEIRALHGAQKTIETSRPICFVEIIKTERDALFSFFRQREYDIYLRRLDALFVPAELPLQLQGLTKLG